LGRTDRRTDGLTDGRTLRRTSATLYAPTLWGHKNSRYIITTNLLGLFVTYRSTVMDRPVSNPSIVTNML
jgi:hypothetical protein